MSDRIEELFQQVMDEVCKDPLRRFAELVAADEREACAKLIEGIEIRKTTYSGWLLKVKKGYADAIRAREEK